VHYEIRVGYQRYLPNHFFALLYVNQVCAPLEVSEGQAEVERAFRKPLWVDNQGDICETFDGTSC
jgi:hypothetical protein